MNAAQLVQTAERLGIALWIDGDSVRAKARRGVITDEFRAELASAKPEIREVLRKPPQLKVVQANNPRAQKHRQLCKYLRGRVGTPDGPGRLWQAFQDRAAVILETTPGRVSFYDPAEIELLELPK